MQYHIVQTTMNSIKSIYIHIQYIVIIHYHWNLFLCMCNTYCIVCIFTNILNFNHSNCDYTLSKQNFTITKIKTTLFSLSLSIIKINIHKHLFQNKIQINTHQLFLVLILRNNTHRRRIGANFAEGKRRNKSCLQPDEARYKRPSCFPSP